MIYKISQRGGLDQVTSTVGMLSKGFKQKFWNKLIKKEIDLKSRVCQRNT